MVLSGPGPLPAWLVWLVAAAAGLWVFMAFLPTLGHDWVDWDDPDNFLNNPHYRGLSASHLAWMWTTFHMGHYQPLAWMTLGLDYQLWGMQAPGYHLTNTLIHALNALAFCWLGWLLLRCAYQADPATGPARLDGAPAVPAQFLLAAAGFAAVLWGAHPLRAEPVAWVTERRDVLSGFFLLLTLIAYVRWQAVARGGRGYRTGGLITLAGFLLCNFSKVIGVTLPLLFLILDFYPLRRVGGAAGWSLRLVGRLLLEKLPFLILAMIFAAIAKLGQEGMQANMSLEQHPLSGRLAVVCYGLMFYIAKTVVPTGLAPLPELHLPVSPAEPRFMAAIVMTAILSVLVAWRARRWPALLAAALAYLVLVGPSSGIVQNGWQLVHDRYSYLPMLGLTLAASGFAAAWVARRPGRLRLAALPALMILVSYSALTWQQAQVWKNTEALWTHAARVTPGSSAALNGFGWVLLQRGETASALDNFRRAIAARGSNEKAHSNLWEALKRSGAGDEELMAAYRDAIARLPFNRNALEAHQNLANAHARRREFDQAEALYERALRLEPNRPMTLYNYGMMLSDRGDLAGAEQKLRSALAQDRELARAYQLLARVLVRQGRRDEARRVLQSGLQQIPGNPELARELERLQPG